MKFKVITFLTLTLLIIIISCPAYSAFQDKVNMPPRSGGTDSEANIIYEYPGNCPESSFQIDIKENWRFTERTIENMMQVVFSPKVFKPEFVIFVTVEENPHITSKETYNEFSKSPLFQINDPENVLDEEVTGKKGAIYWRTTWKLNAGWTVKNENTFAKSEGVEGIVINDVFLKDGVTFSLTAFTTRKNDESFKITFAEVSESFKPGKLPENVAHNTGNTADENSGSQNESTDTDNQEVSYTDTGSAETSPPVIYLLEPEDLVEARNLVVEYEGSEVHITGIADDESGVSRIMVNGREAQLTPVEDEYMEKAEGLVKPLQFKADVLLTIGKNNIEIVAVDIMGNEITENYTLNRGADMGAVTPVKGEQWAVVIGISTFQNSGVNPLNYTDDDALSVYDYLITEGGFPKENVILLLDEEATTVNIRRALGEFLSRNAAKDDLVFIYFAGHGAPERDPASNDADGYSKYIVTYDTDPASLYSTAFPMTEIATIFDRIYAEKIVFFIDSCYSGASGGRTFSGEEGGRAMNISDNFLTEMSGKGRLIITASDANEISLEKDELGHGVFTYYMLEGLKGAGDTDSNGYITVDELYSYLYDKVADVSEQRQHPIKKGESQGHIVIGVSPEAK